jgi:hypothetical protein
MGKITNIKMKGEKRKDTVNVNVMCLPFHNNEMLNGGI